jgi:predicted  nucleic acid-binding Zn-ribbon protein
MADNLPSSSNPSSSQFIPGKLRREITKKEAEIEEINDRWRRNRDEQTKIEEEIEKKKKAVKQLQREIRVEEKRVKDYAEQYPVMQEMINERYDWVRSIKNLYPYDN